MSPRVRYCKFSRPLTVLPPTFSLNPLAGGPTTPWVHVHCIQFVLILSKHLDAYLTHSKRKSYIDVLHGLYNGFDGIRSDYMKGIIVRIHQ
jgi:hypothetical protein